MMVDLSGSLRVLINNVPEWVRGTIKMRFIFIRNMFMKLKALKMLGNIFSEY